MKNLLYLLFTWASLSVFNTHAQKKGTPPLCPEDCKIIKKCECDIFNQNYLGNKEHFIHFNQNGQLIGDMPSIIRKGDKLFFAIEGKDFTNSPLQKKIREYKDGLGNIKYNNLSIESYLLFPDSTAFEEYKKNISSYLPKIDININSIYTLSVQWKEKDTCLKSASPKFNITKLPCDSVAISDVFVVPCDLDEDQVGFTLTRQNIDNILMASYLKENKDCYGQWGQYAPNFDKVKNDFIKKAQVIEDSLRAFDYSLLMGTRKDSLPNDTLLKLLSDNENNLKTVNTYLQKALLNIPENKEWMKKWLWFTGLNAPAMNPFDKIKIDNNSILTADKELAATQRRIDAIGLVIKNSQLSDNNDKIIKKYLNELDTLQQKVVELADNKQDLINRKGTYEKWLIEREIKSNLLYAGVLFISKAEQISWMPNYDALNNYRLSNAPNSIPSVVADIDVLRPLVFNLRRGTKAFSEETVTPFPLTTPITDAFNAWSKVSDGILGIGANLNVSRIDGVLSSSSSALASLSMAKTDVESKIAALGVTLPNYNTIKDLPQPYFMIESGGANNYLIENKEKSRKKQPKNKVILDFKQGSKKTFEAIQSFKMVENSETKVMNWANKYFELKDTLLPNLIKQKAEIERKIELAKFKTNRQLRSATTAQLKWLNAQTSPPLQVILKDNTDTLYHTDCAEAKEKKEKKGAVIIGYDLSVSDGKTATKVVKNASYKQYDLPRFWYGVGLAYIPHPRYTSVYENGAFVNNPEPQQLDVVVGAKIYPFKPMNQMRTCKLAKYTHYGKYYDYLRGNGHLNRLSMFVGLGVRYKFLRNYFVGVGYDIIPGININAGYNFYFKRTYDVENGKLINSYERLVSGGRYFSITTDVEVFKRLVQLINPF